MGWRRLSLRLDRLDRCDFSTRDPAETERGEVSRRAENREEEGREKRGLIRRSEAAAGMRHEEPLSCS